MKFRAFATALTVMLYSPVLVACNTVDKDIDAALQAKLPQYCAAGETMYATFKTWHESGGSISNNALSSIEAAYASMRTLCDSPETATAARVLAASALLAARIQNAGRN